MPHCSGYKEENSFDETPLPLRCGSTRSCRTADWETYCVFYLLELLISDRLQIGTSACCHACGAIYRCNALQPSAG